MKTAEFKEKLALAYEHGKSVGAYYTSGLPSKYAPYTFDSWYQLTFGEQEYASQSKEPEGVSDENYDFNTAIIAGGIKVPYPEPISQNQRSKNVGYIMGWRACKKQSNPVVTEDEIFEEIEAHGSVVTYIVGETRIEEVCITPDKYIDLAKSIIKLIKLE